MNFLAGFIVGALWTYAALLYLCHRAAERFAKTVQDEIDQA